MAFKVKQGSVTITLDDGMERIVRDILAETNPGIVEYLEENAGELFDYTKSRWPENTGLSKDSLSHDIIVSDKSIRTVVTNSAKYAKYIKSKKKGLGGRSAMVELMTKPNKVLLERVKRDLGPMLAKRFGGK